MKSLLVRMYMCAIGGLGLLACLCHEEAMAQVPDVCLPATGGLASVPILDGTVSGDAGWNGATQLNLSGDNGATTAAKLLMGKASFGGQQSIFIGLAIDAPNPSSDTTVVLAFIPDDAVPNRDWRLHIKPFATGGPQATFWNNTTSHIDWNALTATGNPSTASQWPLQNLRVTRSGNHWELELVVPIGPAPSGVAFGSGSNPNRFQFYANVMNTSFGGGPSVGQDVWPPTSVLPAGPITQNTPNPSTSNTWGRVWLQNAPANACTGVKLEWAQIGVQDPNNSSGIVNTIRRVSAASISQTLVAQCEALPDHTNPSLNGEPNRFLARPENTMSTSANVSVTFRLADWGIPGIDPNAATGGTPRGGQALGLFKPLGAPVPTFVPAPPAPQMAVSCDPTINGSPQCAGVPAKGTPGGNPTQQLPINSGGSTAFQASWTLNYKQSCFYKFADTPSLQGTSHQCMQVDMDSTDPNTRFLNRSVQRNMDFVPASTIKRSAIVSGDQGPLPPSQTKHRFLLQVGQEEWGRPNVGTDRSSEALRGSVSTGQAGFRQFRDATLNLMAKQQFEQDVDHMLSWIVRSYIYTGTKIIIDGREYEYVRRGADFGIVAGHAGHITGWSASLASAPTSSGTALQSLDTESTLFALAVAPEQRSTLEVTISAHEANRFAVWLALGRTLPQGGFGNQHRGSSAATLGFEYILTPAYSLEATLARHSFTGKNGGGELDVTQFGVNGKWYFARPGFKPFLTAGVGGYAFDPGSTRFGVNLGAGVQVDLAPQWSLEGRYTLHQVTNNSPNSSYSTLTLGLRYAF